MRTIKFRAWDKEGKEMFRVVMLSFLPDKIIVGGRGGSTDTKGKDGCVLMQFTGLTDKNGKEIYSSDILRHSDVLGSEFYVRWNNERARFQLENKEGKELMGQLFNDEYFVIGNEFEGLTDTDEGDIMGVYDKNKKRQTNNNK